MLKGIHPFLGSVNITKHGIWTIMEYEVRSFHFENGLYQSFVLGGLSTAYVSHHKCTKPVHMSPKLSSCFDYTHQHSVPQNYIDFT